MIKKILFSAFLGTVCIYSLALSQTTTGTVTGEVQTPQTQPTEPGVFPEYIVRPSEDLNPYGLSSMDSATGIDYRKGEGTLGTRIDRKSNAEVNKAISERKKQLRANEEESSENSGVERGSEDIDNEIGYETLSPSSSSGKKLIRWVDDKGAVHITNDVGTVPQKYRNQIVNQIGK